MTPLFGVKKPDSRKDGAFHNAQDSEGVLPNAGIL